jgi:hypothetical protein
VGPTYRPLCHHPSPLHWLNGAAPSCIACIGIKEPVSTSVVLTRHTPRLAGKPTPPSPLCCWLQLPIVPPSPPKPVAALLLLAMFSPQVIALPESHRGARVARPLGRLLSSRAGHCQALRHSRVLFIPTTCATHPSSGLPTLSHCHPVFAVVEGELQ